MKFFFHNPYRELEQRLGYAFRDRSLLAMALLHRSYRFESEDADSDNQRLEFLGDAALGLVASAYLFAAFPQMQEGTLTCLRSRMTSGKTLAQIGLAVGIGERLKLGKGEKQTGGHSRASNVGDALEAVLGAAYLDGGLKAVRKIFAKMFIPQIEIRPEDNWSDNPKGQLQVIAQQQMKMNPKYHVVRQEGPPHAKVFTVEVILSGAGIGKGRGATKREAEQQAAQHAIQVLRQKGVT